MVTNLVDFHCHLDLYPDFESLVQECERDGIHTLAVTTTPKAWPRNKDLALGMKFVRVALGLHPQLVGERAHELDLWKEYLSQSRYVGEVGLDGSSPHSKSLALQKQVFEKILKLCAEAGEKILTIHSLRSVPVVLDMIETHLSKGSCKVILHWFTGTTQQARRAADLGCYFSVNARMSNDHHHEVIRQIPITRILTETDGPFTLRKGSACRPRDVQDAMNNVAVAVKLDIRVVREQILSNLAELER